MEGGERCARSGEDEPGPGATWGICWDLGDVVFDEATEVMTPDGVTASAELVPGVGELIRSLHARRVPMAVVSDTRIGACEAVLGAHGLTDCIAHAVISEEIGVEKPHPAMFLAASDLLGIAPCRLAMVGNNYGRDVVGAHGVGMTTVWFHWNDRYPAPTGAVADYVATDADELRDALERWIASLDPSAGGTAGEVR